MKHKIKTKKTLVKFLTLITGVSLVFGLFLMAPQTANALQTCELNLSEFGDIFTSADFDWDEANDCDEITTSFVEFEGGLAPPSGVGLAGELTQVADARTLILNITNFILSFLGLAAILVIIYGGFLFVTSRGNEEQATSGKKTILYAVIGVLVVLISFALVNTLIRQAPRGGDGEAGQEIIAGSETRTSAEVFEGQRLFNIAALEIQSSLQNFLLAYQRMTRIANQLDAMKQLQIPRDAQEARNFLRTLDIALREIMRAAEPFSKTNVAARKIQKDFVEIWRNASNEKLEEVLVSMLTIPKIPFAQKAYAQSRNRPETFYADGAGDFHADFREIFDGANITQTNEEDFLDKLEDIKRRLAIVKEGLGPLSQERAEEFLRRGITSEKELQLALEEISPDMTIGEAFARAEEKLTEAESLARDTEDVALVRDASKKLLVLYTLIRDIKFMAVRINATKAEGNAPLTVQFTSIGSLDPSGETIADAQHEWDLDGNGISKEEVNSLGCNERAGASVTCTYELAGTYRIGLRLNPKDGVKQVASGIGVLTLKVHPPRSRIDLEAQVGDISESLHAYDDQGRIIVNKNQWNVTLTEAENGVRYDASKTTDGTGQMNGIVNFEWTFGDNSNAITGPTVNIIDNPKKTYNQTGTFPLRLEVTDKGGVQDRKIVNIVVTSIAARIEAKTFRGDLNTTFEFDGTRSASDLGRIVSYEWSIIDPEGNELENLQNNRSELFRHQFDTAGKYAVKLRVADQSGEEAETEATVFVESQKPVANFKIRGCVLPNEPCIDPAKPSLVEFDASESFDPDAGDTLRYTWEVLPPAYEGINYTVVEGALEDDERGNEKIKLKFEKTGAYRIKLKVEDQHRDPELRKSAELVKELTVASTVDLSWDENMLTSRQLEGATGEATFEFLAYAKNATGYEIEYGDGETDEFVLEPDETEIRANHTYTEAGVYNVLLSASSEENGETKIRKSIYVAAPDTPISIIKLAIEGQPVFFESDDPVDPPLLRGTRISFDASESLNTSGERGTDLVYSWDFGDGDRSSNARTIHTYEDISPEDPGYFEVKLEIRDTDTGKTAETKANIPVIGAKPRISNLIVRKISQGNETPLDFNITAEGARDADGHITEFTFWYFDEDDPDRKLGVITTALPSAVLTIETKGQQGEEKRYAFCAEAKDNENNVSTCEELFPNQNTLPFATVINGPNQAPNAEFTTDRTSIVTGESVTFTSSSVDPDGEIVSYVWDVMGDGFHNDSETELSRITQTYNEKSPAQGYRVKLKVIDDRNAAGFSQEIPIFVDLPFNPPTAEFVYDPATPGTAEIQFTSVNGTLLSRPAPGGNATLQRFEWDFDTSREFCDGGTRCPTQVCQNQPKLCDRDPTNDPDSLIQNPVHEYPTSGQYSVRLTLEDSNGQKDDIIKVVAVARGAATPQAAAVLDAKIRTTPPYQMEGTRKVMHLQPPFGNYDNVEFYFGDSLGNINEYVFDRNIFFDSGRERIGIDQCVNPPEIPPEEAASYFGDGCTDNDADIVTSDGSRTFSVRYGRPSPVTEYFTAHPEGIFRARVTVYGTDQNNTIITDTDEVDIIFDPATITSELGAFAVKKFGPKGAIIVGLLSGAILAFIGYYVSLIFRGGKPREI